MTSILLFVFGMVFGSFGYVLVLRYDGDHFLLDPKIAGGRSYCPHCGKTLRWFELIPFVSFAVQGGRCRHCKAHIGFAYPLMEILFGFLFVFVAGRVQEFYGVSNGMFWTIAVLWIAFFFALLLLSVIDVRLGIIPDEIVVFLTAVAAGIVGFSAMNSGLANISFLGPFSSLFGIQQNIFASHLFGTLLGVLFLGGLVALTHGKGMGMGDVKLAVPLGFALGWPDVVLFLAATFVSGAAVGLLYISLGKKTMKSAVPFGPFLAFAALFIFFWGSDFINWYFRVMGF